MFERHSRQRDLPLTRHETVSQRPRSRDDDVDDVDAKRQRRIELLFDNLRISGFGQTDLEVLGLTRGTRRRGIRIRNLGVRREARRERDGKPGAADCSLECPCKVTVTREPQSPSLRVPNTQFLHDRQLWIRGFGIGRSLQSCHLPEVTRGRPVNNEPVTTSPPSATRGGRWLVAIAIVLLAANLRAAVGSVGVVLESVRADLAMSATVGGLLTTLPVVCFAIFGVGSAGVVRRLGLHLSAAILLTMIAVGLVTRSLVHSSSLFLLCSTIALAGAAVGNVILPPLVKAHFPDRIAFVSSLYGAALMAGASFSSLATVPLSNALGGWRAGLAAWAILAVVALIPWLLMLRGDVHTDPVAHERLPLRQVMHSPLVWAMLLLFAAQSAGAYAQFGWFPEILTDAGISRGYAGALLAIISGVGIPLTLALPWLIRVTGETPYLPWLFGSVTAAGWLGVLLAPASVPWLWAILLGIGGAAFTWTLTMIARRTRTTAGTATLSVATQGLGYLLAGLGPFGVGALHDATGSWTVPLIALIVVAGLVAVFGTIVARPVMLEDTLKP